MKKIKQLKKWGIYELSPKEQQEHGFKFAVIHPNNMGVGLLSPNDTDMEDLNTLEQAEHWINHYND